MLVRISRPATLSLLEQLTPTLVNRARYFSHSKIIASASAQPQTKIQDGPLINSKTREKIMAHTESRRAITGKAKEIYNIALGNVDASIKVQNLASALEHWQGLEQYRKKQQNPDQCRLPISLLKEVHRLFVASFLSVVDQEQWTDSMKNTAKDFALQAAKYHSAQALSLVMIYFIKSNDAATVLRMYDDYLETIGPDSLLGPAVEADPVENPSLALPDVEHNEAETGDPGRAHVVVAAVTAHAMNDSFKGALDTYLASNTIVRIFHRRRVFSYLPDRHVVSKVKNYFDRLSIAARVARPSSFTMLVMSQSHPESVELLEKSYAQILDGIFGQDPYIAADASQLSDTRVVAMAESEWTSLQTGFIRGERIDLAAKVWDDMAAAGVKPGVTMWTGLLDIYSQLRNSKQAMIAWNMMLKEGITPDHLSYRAIISSLFDDNKTKEALERFEEYKAILGGRDESGIPTFNTVLHFLLLRNLVADATSLWAEMQKKGPKPDLVAYNTFLGFYGRQKDFKGLSDILSQMSSAGIVGDVVTYSTILSALIAVGRKDAHTTIMKMMRKQGITPNIATYSSIIDAQMREEKMANLETALSLLDRMEKDDGVKPNEITYTAILSGLYRGSWISRASADKVRADLVARMRKDGIKFRVPTYHILIRAALDSPDENGYLDALGLLEEMERVGIPRVGNTWYILFAGLMSRGLWDVAQDMVKKMLNSGHEPNGTLRRMMNDIRKHRTLRI